MAFVRSLEAPALDAADAHHLGRVLRLRAGEAVAVGDGAGSWRPCTFVPPAGLAVSGQVATVAPPAPAVAVGFVPTKGDRPEWAVQKLTELGVDRIVLLASARSVVRWDGARAARHLDKLREVARLAAMQSRRLWLPSVEGIVALPDLLPVGDGSDGGSRDPPGGGPPGGGPPGGGPSGGGPPGGGPSGGGPPAGGPPGGGPPAGGPPGGGPRGGPEGGRLPIRWALAVPGGAPPGFLAPPGGRTPPHEAPVAGAGVLVGPEGGWTAEEEAACPRTVGLGDGVLRTETAALAAGALLCALRAGLVSPAAS